MAQIIELIHDAKVIGLRVVTTTVNHDISNSTERKKKKSHLIVHRYINDKRVNTQNLDEIDPHIDVGLEARSQCW